MGSGLTLFLSLIVTLARPRLSMTELSSFLSSLDDPNEVGPAHRLLHRLVYFAALST